MMKQSQIDKREVPPRPSGKPPRYLREDYPGAEDEMAEDVFAAIYWQLRDGMDRKSKEPIDYENDVAVHMQLIVEAMSETGVQVNRIKSRAELAQTKVIALIQKNGFFRLMRGEYTNIGEWLADKIPELPAGSGGLSVATFLYEDFLPLLEQVDGISPEKLMSFRDNWSKTQAAAPYLRQHVEMVEKVDRSYEERITNTEIEIGKLSKEVEDLPKGEERSKLEGTVKTLKKNKKLLETERVQAFNTNKKNFQKALANTLEVITDPTIPAWGPNNVKDVLMRNGEINIFAGQKCYLANGDVVFTVVLPKDYEFAAESMTRQLCTFNMTDGKIMVAELGKRILKKE